MMLSSCSLILIESRPVLQAKDTRKLSQAYSRLSASASHSGGCSSIGTVNMCLAWWSVAQLPVAEAAKTSGNTYHSTSTTNIMPKAGRVGQQGSEVVLEETREVTGSYSVLTRELATVHSNVSLHFISSL